MSVQTMQLGFDYESLEPEEQSFVRYRAARIHELARATAEGVRMIGQYLTEVKVQLGHGKFLEWIEREFAWSEWSARRFMTVHERFKTSNLTDLEIDVSALYLIAAPKTPEPVRGEVMRRAEAGERITRQVALDAIAEFRERGTLPQGVSMPQIIEAAESHHTAVHQDLPSPEVARNIAIQTGKHTLDSEGTYQPPVTEQVENEWLERMRLLDAVCDLAQSDLLRRGPREFLESFTELHTTRKLRELSLEVIIQWLTKFEEERSRRYGRSKTQIYP
jgi:Protein of unknown function (DUF3102)